MQYLYEVICALADRCSVCLLGGVVARLVKNSLRDGKNFCLVFLCCLVFSVCGCDCCNCCCKQQAGHIIYKNGKYYKVSSGKNGDESLQHLTQLQDFIDNIVPMIKYNKQSRNTLLCDKSIFDEPSRVKYKTIYDSTQDSVFIKSLEGSSGSVDISGLDDKAKRAVGCMVGMAVGDSVGAPCEFNAVDKRFYDAKDYNNVDTMGVQTGFKPFPGDREISPGQWTDDTSMGLCLADSIIVNDGQLKPLDVMNRFLSWWYCGYNNASRFDKNGPVSSWGLGGNISSSFSFFLSNPALERTTAGDQYTSGNGSIMRNAAIPIAFNDMSAAMKAAEDQSYITHQGKEAAECCKLLTFICRKFINGEKINNMKNSLTELLKEGSEIYKYLNLESVIGLAKSQINVTNHKYPSNKENWNWKADVFEYNPERLGSSGGGYVGSYAMDCMAMSLHILYHTTSFKQAIDVAAKLCGDADSVASVVGQIAGAFYGIQAVPKEWLGNLYTYDHGETAIRALILNQLNLP